MVSRELAPGIRASGGTNPGPKPGLGGGLNAKFGGGPGKPGGGPVNRAPKNQRNHLNVYSRLQ